MVLTKKELTKFKKTLEEMKQQIIHTLKGSTAEVKTSDESMGYSQHQADQGTDDFDRTVNLEITSKEFEILRQINRAIEKINENTYGECDISGEKIPKKRLEAIPYATMTVESQEKLEKGLL